MKYKINESNNMTTMLITVIKKDKGTDILILFYVEVVTWPIRKNYFRLSNLFQSYSFSLVTFTLANVRLMTITHRQIPLQ